MNKEQLFRALTEIGDDLLLAAQTKRFVNPWKRWGKLAACIALVLCLGVVALPYFPVGCGAVEQAPAALVETPEETPAETPAEAPAMEETAEEECAPLEEPKDAPQEVVTVWVNDVAYELTVQIEWPEDLGEELGVVKTCDGRDLIGCKVFAVPDSEDIYVEVSEGVYLRGVRAGHGEETP